MDKKIKVMTKVAINTKPDDNTMTKVCVTNHITEMKTVNNSHNVLSRFKRLNNDEYVDKETGEICQYQHKEKSKARNLNNSFERLRQLINANFTCSINELHVTLTYREKMDCFDTVSKDFKKFWGKLRYHYPDLEFIRIFEPQHRGSWHIHLLLKCSTFTNLFISKDEIEKLWGHGFAKVTKIKGNDNIGAYFTAFLKDIDAFEKDDTEASDRKLIVKQARLQFYPPDKRFYGNSKGIKKPSTFNVPYGRAKELVNSKDLCFQSAISVVITNIETNEEKVVNTIFRQQFNSKRKKNQE